MSKRTVLSDFGTLDLRIGQWPQTASPNIGYSGGISDAPVIAP